jgi:hypothetical protein
MIIASKLTERAIRVDRVTAMESKNIRGILVCIFIVSFEKSAGPEDLSIVFKSCSWRVYNIRIFTGC